MTIDGNKINEDIKNELRGESKGLSLAVILVGDNPVSAKYTEKKKKFGEEIGVAVEVFKYGAGLLTSELAEEMRDILKKDFSGIIVQLPLPIQIDTPAILNILPLDKDVDLLSDQAYQNFVAGSSKILPPVVASIKEIFERGNVGDLHGLNAMVVGRGKLVGRPVATWLQSQGVTVELLGRETIDLVPFAKSADIIIAGAGVPNLLKPDMVREGAIVIDAATADVDGQITGDVDKAVAPKCRIFSPVPGGVGPITVAMLFKNLITLAGH